jgi:adenylylsulfate kinase
MAGKVVWLTGIPGSGKTTIGELLQKRLESSKPVVLLDGDTFRKERCQDLGFTVQDRRENLRRATEEAKAQSAQGKTVIIAFTSPFDDLREKASHEMPTLLVYVKASIATCERRDPKGLYRQAREGSITNFVPFDIPYEEPKNPDITVDTESSSPDQCVDRIMSALKSFEYSGNGYVSFDDLYLTNIQRNRSLIKTTAAVMAAMCAVLSAYFIYADIFLSVPAGTISISPKLFVAAALAVGASVILYNIKTFSKRRAARESSDHTISKQRLYNRITLAASATFCVVGVLSLYYDIDVVPPIGEWNFTYSFYVGMGCLMGSLGTFIMFGIRKYRTLAYKNR